MALHLDDTSLLAQFHSPSTKEKGYTGIVKKYQEKLYWHIRRMLVDHEDTNDVLQGVLIKIWNGLENFREDSKLFTWMYRIATNEALTYIKQKAKRNGFTPLEYQEKAVAKLESDPYFEGDVFQLQLQQAIAKLPEKQQLVFKMKYFEEMKYENISEILDTSVGGLKANYHHAVKKIEEYLKNN